MKTIRIAALLSFSTLLPAPSCTSGASDKGDTSADTDTDTDSDTDTDTDTDSDTDTDTDTDSDTDTDTDTDTDSGTAGADVLLNEIAAANTKGPQDEDGKYEDWLELYNAGDEAADLSGWQLSDSAEKPWALPDGTSLAPGAYLLIWCDDDESDGPLHATFKLTATEGETVKLATSNGSAVDSVSFPALDDDTTYARIPDGSDSWAVTSTPTPEAANR